MKKDIEILNYSNPNKVYKKLEKLFPNGYFELKLSGRKDKKYAIRGTFSDDKWINFGQMFYEDYTYHNDEERRDAFKNRNWKWEFEPKNTAAWLSYHVLW